MRDLVQVLLDSDEIKTYLGRLSEETEPVAKDTFWQLFDFEFQRIIVISSDLHLARDDDMFSEAWFASEGITQGAGLKTLLVVEGSIISQGSVSLSEDYGIVRGDLTCESLFVDGEALFVCFGTCKARYIEQTYNGVSSCIQRAETGFFFMSSDPMLKLIELNPGAIVCEAGCDAEVLESTFVDGMLCDGWITREGLDRIAQGESVLRWDCHEILHQVSLLPVDTDRAVAALASIEGIKHFRFWDNRRPKGTVLHALAALDAPTNEMRRWIQALTKAGVPLHTLSHGKDHHGRDSGPGNAPQVAVVAGNVETAIALADEGVDINASVGTLGLSEMIAANPAASRATVELLSELDYPGFGEAERVLRQPR